MIVVNGAVVVGGEDDGTYIVDASKCGPTTHDPHFCTHDWRIRWGNVEKTDQ